LIGAETDINHCRSAQPMSLMGQVLLLPHRNTDDRFTPISRLYLKLIGSPENLHKTGTTRGIQPLPLCAKPC
jgi:hypothetical protein